MQTSHHAVGAFDASREPASETSPDDIELIDIKELCRLFGGSRPVHPSTVYRMIQAGKLPPANKELHRWVKGRAVAAIKALLEEPA
jgi:predicted DNA-binding transcriptional regulator AlpA